MAVMTCRRNRNPRLSRTAKYCKFDQTASGPPTSESQDRSAYGRSCCVYGMYVGGRERVGYDETMGWHGYSQYSASNGRATRSTDKGSAGIDALNRSADAHKEKPKRREKGKRRD